MTNQYVTYEDFVIDSFQDNKRNHSDIKDPDDLDLWTSDPKVNRGHLLVKTIYYVIHGDFVKNSFQDNELKPG
jgi:hypothetical protein